MTVHESYGTYDFLFLDSLFYFLFPYSCISEPKSLMRLITYLSDFTEGTFEMKSILQFLDYNKFPLVTKLTELNSVRAYSSPIKLQVSMPSTCYISLIVYYLNDFRFLFLSVYNYFMFLFRNKIVKLDTNLIKALV